MWKGVARIEKEEMRSLPLAEVTDRLGDRFEGVETTLGSWAQRESLFQDDVNDVVFFFGGDLDD